MEFKDTLKERRIQLGLTLEDVGNAVGVSKATVQRWESGVIKNIKRDKISALASVLQLTPAKLMGWSEEEQSKVDEQYELQEYLEELKNRPEMRMLFQLSKDATKEDVEKAVAIIEALKGK